jgi:hypothetical protein
MAFISNLQRETYNENLAKGNFPTVIATFQINQEGKGGGQYPYSLFKIQTNWSSASLVVNSELYVNQTILSSGIPYYVPNGETGNDDGDFPISGSTNASKYSHLLFSDNPDVLNYFKISFSDLRNDPDNPADYYLIDVVATTPNRMNGNLIADSSCYILNTV